jgi:hypothetical protein
MITDKMIEDIIKLHIVMGYDYKSIKERLIKKGYEVEEKKSKINEMIDYYKNIIHFFHDDQEKVIVANLKKKCHEAIEEIQEQHEKEMIHWQDAYVKKHKPIPQHLIEWLEYMKMTGFSNTENNANELLNIIGK